MSCGHEVKRKDLVLVIAVEGEQEDAGGYSSRAALQRLQLPAPIIASQLFPK